MILTILISVFFDSDTGKFLLAFEIILIPVMFIMSLLLAGGLKARVEIPYYHARKNNEFRVDIRLTNQSILPIAVCNVRVKCTNSFTGRTFFMEENAMVDGNSESTLEFYLKSSYCGRYEIQIIKVTVFDYLRVFAHKMRLNGNTDEIMVLPQFHRIVIGGSAASKTKHEWEQYSHTSSGEDTSEVFDVHEYRQGDTLQRVHWKLTAKTDEYLVKEYSRPLENMIFLFTDMRCEEVGHPLQDKIDHFLEILAALSWSLIWEGISHVVIWYSKDNKRLEIAHIEFEKDVYRMIECIFGEHLYDDEVDVRRMYTTEHETIREDHSLMIDMEGRIYKGDRCIKQFHEEEIEEELVEWKLEI